jgi:pyruvate/2-oxoglutarate/acetoin dehydrogenase E1 component
MGGGFGYGATHSQSIEKIFLGVPNLLVLALNIFVSPNYILNRGLGLRMPLLLIENKIDYRRDTRNPVDQFDSVRIFSGDFPEVEIKNHDEDSDVIVITYGGSVGNVAEVCSELETTVGLKFTLFIFVLLSPLNIQSLVSSLGGTKRIVIVEEGIGAQGFGSELMARLAESGYSDLVFRRVSTLGIIPANELGEQAQLPNSDRIKEAIISILG